MLKESTLKKNVVRKGTEKFAFSPWVEKLLGRGPMPVETIEVYQPAAKTGAAWAHADQEVRHISFTFAVIALAARLSQVDGEANHQEFATFRALFPMQDNQNDKIQNLFDMACLEETRFEHYVHQIVRLFPDNKNLLTELLDRLFKIAASDGPLQSTEVDFLRQTGTILGVTATEFQRMLNQYSPPKPPNMYAILGVSPRISDADLKAHYRRLIQQYHPDGHRLSADEAARANRKLASINEAYDRILRKRGMK